MQTFFYTDIIEQQLLNNRWEITPLSEKVQVPVKIPAQKKKNTQQNTNFCYQQNPIKYLDIIFVNILHTLVYILYVCAITIYFKRFTAFVLQQ